MSESVQYPSLIFGAKSRTRSRLTELVETDLEMGQDSAIGSKVMFWPQEHCFTMTEPEISPNMIIRIAAKGDGVTADGRYRPRSEQLPYYRSSQIG